MPGAWMSSSVGRLLLQQKLLLSVLPFFPFPKKESFILKV